MEVKTILTLLSILVIFAGIYAIYASFKNLHKNYSHRRLKHKLIQKILGVNGARVFYAILGMGLIVFGTFILFLLFIKPKLGNEFNNRTDKFLLVSKTINHNGYSMISSTTCNFEQLNHTIEIKGKNELNKYIKASFKNNYLDKVPDIVWEMKNLRVIDFTYNNITQIDIDKLSKMDSLKTLILRNNPISSEEIKKIKEKTGIKVIY